MEEKKEVVDLELELKKKIKSTKRQVKTKLNKIHAALSNKNCLNNFLIIKGS